MTKRPSPSLQVRRGGFCYEGFLKARLGEGASVDSVGGGGGPDLSGCLPKSGFVWTGDFITDEDQQESFKTKISCACVLKLQEKGTLERL